MHKGAGDVLSTFAREAHGIRLSAAYKLAGVLSTASNLKRNILKTDTNHNPYRCIYQKYDGEMNSRSYHGPRRDAAYASLKLHGRLGPRILDNSVAQLSHRCKSDSVAVASGFAQ